MLIRYLGHASFEIITDKFRLLTDPLYYSHFPGSRRTYDPVKAEDVYDYITITHEHPDHCDLQLIDEIFSDKTKIITTPEVSMKIHHPCVTLNADQVYDDGIIKVTATHAEHQEAVNPVGFLIEAPERIYFAGDTDFFQAIGEVHSPYIAFLPVGGRETMNVTEAASAASLIRPLHIFPMHYNTWKDITADMSLFRELVAQKTVATELHVLSPGEHVEIKGEPEPHGAAAAMT